MQSQITSNFYNCLIGKDKLFSDLLKYEKDNHQKFPITLLIIELDDFVSISEYFGYDVAIHLMSQLSFWIKEQLNGKNANLYAYGASKLTLLFPTRLSLIDVNNFIKYIFSEISKKTFYVNKNAYNITITIGVSRGRKDLLKKSFLALDLAKKSKKPYIYYNEKKGIESKFLNNIKIHQEIKNAINNDMVIPVLQPIFDYKQKKIIKYESLMRLKSEDGGYIYPDNFLDIAKKARLYNILTKKMINESLKLLKKIKKPISINISFEDIDSPQTVNYIYRQIKNSKMGNLITFEIVESTEISSFKKVENFIKKLKTLGCEFAIDDFGSGYSNFENILQLDIDYVKIDGSLIKNLDKNKTHEILVKNIVNIANDLNVKTVAEYVWNRNIFEKVKKLGIDFMQGYFIGRPKQNIA